MSLTDVNYEVVLFDSNSPYWHIRMITTKNRKRNWNYLKYFFSENTNVVH